MLLLELLQDIRLLLLVARRLALLLLPLIKHHFLDHTACLAVQVAQLAVLGLYLGGVDLGRGSDDVRPPLHLVYFVEVDGDFFAGADGGEGPGGVVDADGVREVALGKVLDFWLCRRERICRTYIDEWLLSSYTSLQSIPAKLDVQVLALVLSINGDADVEVLDSLVPLVWQRSLFGLLLCACLGVGLLLLLGRW
jgi:hypothetical protein